MTSATLSTLAQPRLLAALAFAAGAGALIAALIAEHGFGLRPCILCHWQRYAHVAAAGLAMVALLLPRRLPRVVLGGAAVAFLASGAIAGFHVGVEQHWWEGTAGCHAPAFDPNASVEELEQILLGTDFVPCDQVAWSLFGISMAGYNVIYSLAAGVLLLYLTVKARPPRKEATQ